MLSFYSMLLTKMFIFKFISYTKQGANIVYRTQFLLYSIDNLYYKLSPLDSITFLYQ